MSDECGTGYEAPKLMTEIQEIKKKQDQILDKLSIIAGCQIESFIAINKATLDIKSAVSQAEVKVDKSEWWKLIAIVSIPCAANLLSMIAFLKGCHLFYW